MSTVFGVGGAVSVEESEAEHAGQFANLGAEIENKGGYDILKFKIEPGASLTTNQESMAFMDGGLIMKATMGQGGIGSAILRGFTGTSAMQTEMTNPTQTALRLYLSPFMQGSIVEVKIAAGETWNFADKSFLACTPNLKVSGNLNVFRNFKLLFAGGNLSYVSISAPADDGIAWIYAYGSSETHEIEMGASPPLFINHGCFLGMKSEAGGVNYWSDYVKVGTSNGLLQAIFTDTGFVMKISDTVPPKRPGVKCVVMTQSLNRAHFEKYINNIAKTEAQSVMASQSSSDGSSGSTVTGLIPALWRMGNGGTHTFKRSRTGKKSKRNSETRKSVQALRDRHPSA